MSTLAGLGIDEVLPAYSHLVHLEHTGLMVNKGADVDAWYRLVEG